MPTIIEIDGLKIKIFKEGRYKEAHVHAFKAGCEAKISLVTLEAYYVQGFTKRDVGKIEKYVASKKEILLTEWQNLNSKD